MKTTWMITVLAITVLGAAWVIAASGSRSETHEVPSQLFAVDGTLMTIASQDEDSVRAVRENNDMAIATFGAGCFWSVEAAFRNTEGVTATAVGYAGGHVENPTYRQVCSDETGHAEVVKVEYDPSQVSYDQLLDIFWNAHDPTQVNRQGPDIGYQYRSVIFYHTPEQQATAERSKQQLDESAKYQRPIATAIEEAPRFWRAEEYHQQYLEKRGLATCRIK